MLTWPCQDEGAEIAPLFSQKSRKLKLMINNSAVSNLSFLCYLSRNLD